MEEEEEKIALRNIYVSVQIFQPIKKNTPEIEIQGIEAAAFNTTVCTHLRITSIQQAKQKVHPLLSLRFSCSNHNNIHRVQRQKQIHSLHSHRTRYFSLFRKRLHGCCCRCRRCCVFSPSFQLCVINGKITLKIY